MKRIKHVLLAAVIFLAVLFSSAQPGNACTSFLLQKDNLLVFGKNFDFHNDIGMVIINQRNIAKCALLNTNEKPVQWVSKYGSITFNQVSREFPFGGMNETGLVVEIMWLQETQFPAPDDRPAIPELQWIQYQLDNFSSVDEVVKCDSSMRISQSSPVHFLAADHTGKAVTIEFINGKADFHTARDLPVKVLTNNTYRQSLGYLKTHQGFGGTKPIADSAGSLDRFARAAQQIDAYRPKTKSTAPPVEYAFTILTSVSQGKYTVWSIVYDIPNSQVYFKTVGKKKIKIIRLRDFDFSRGLPVKALDMNTDLEGDVTNRLVNYTDEMNRDLVFATFKNYRENNFLSNIPDSALEILAKYPGTGKCK